MEFIESEYSERDVKRMVAVLQKEYSEILSRKRKRKLGEWKRYSHSRSSSRIRSSSRSRVRDSPSIARDFPPKVNSNRSRSRSGVRNSRSIARDFPAKVNSNRSSSRSVVRDSPSVARDLPAKVNSIRKTEHQRSFSKSTESRRSTPSKEPSVGRTDVWGDTTPSRTPSRCRMKSAPKWSVDIKREGTPSRSRSRDVPMKREKSSSRSMSLKRGLPIKRERTRSRTRSRTPQRDRNYRRPMQRRSRSLSKGKRGWAHPYKPKQPRSPYRPKQQRSPYRPKQQLSRSRNRGRKPQAYMAGDWECSCGQHNFARRVICFRCEAPHNKQAADMKGLPRKRPSPNNRPNLPRWRGQPYVPGDWQCPSCGVNNFARRVKCFECYAPRASKSTPNRSRSPSVSTSATPPPEALMTYKKRKIRSRSSTWEREKSRSHRVPSKRRKEVRKPQYSSVRKTNYTQNRPYPKRVVPRGGSPTRPGALERPTNFRDRVTRLARAITGSRVRKVPAVSAEDLTTNGTQK